MRELTNWLSGRADPDSFPYFPVTAEFHRNGKHFVATELLARLAGIRARLGVPVADAGPARLLRDFLDVALDKWDDRYDYRSYLGLTLLGLPCDDGDDAPGRDLATARRERDRLLVRLIADALAFESAAAVGDTELLPEQRPGPQTVAKRHRHGLRAVAPALSRLGLAGAVEHPQPAAAVAALHALAVADRSAEEERALRLSMLPVYVSHDEYLFIRVLQAYECTFAALADELRGAIADLTGGRGPAAAERLESARQRLVTAGPLFSMLATMQAESFRTFRAYTEGASAIQSRSYKAMESLCRTPEGDRLDSPAYRSVPEVRERVRAGRPCVDAAYTAAARDGRLAGPERDLVRRRMREFASAVLQWRRTHHRLAVRMLGAQPGTGYTEGTPYLAGVRAIPVFTAVADEPDPSAAEPTGGCPE
ncbi:tryptophan 2,3-dioxygenase family protein [Micromonospora sp. DT233]|uniref:tryptophan 2,3-dioxygenase family protein n=1 Tax=Micromonospora sp. DT233 TaxID=3393432 RepID=UPI003CF7AB21